MVACKGAAHSPQKRAAGEFSNPHREQRRLNGAAHCSQNFSPSGFSAPQLEQRIIVSGVAGSRAVFRQARLRDKSAFGARRRRCHLDHACVLEAAQKTALYSRHIDLVLHAARVWRQRLQAEAEQAVALATLVDQVILRSNGLDVSIRLPLVDTLTLQLGGEICLSNQSGR